MCSLFGGPNERDDDAAGGGCDRTRIHLDDTTDCGRTSVLDMAQRMVPHLLRQPHDQISEVQELIGEGAQLLEHARLAQCTVVGNDRTLQWVLTRRGRSVIADGSVTEVLAKLA
jgi:hypothetical protein